MNKVFAAAVSIPKTGARSLSVTGVRCTKLAEIKKKQAFFQRDPDVPVYISGGAFDKVLYAVTVGLTFVSLIGGFNSLYKFSKK